MIRWTRSGKINAAKYMEAIQWGKEIAEYTNKKHGTQTTVYIDSFGEYGTIRWFWDCADLATLEKVGLQLFADPEYLKKISRGPEFLVPGSVVDIVMRSI
ncbi:MAG: hypothetical protein LLG97_10115 [Deltaproteobacteria bacterium]|nr:hypothetical protein [Deltaproteobacteria bacterium]